MKTQYKFAFVAVPLAIIAFALSRVIWPDPAGMAGPSSSLIPHFIFLGALESLSFGLGVAFLIFGWSRVVAALPENNALATASFVAIAWMLISWWPHDNMHRVNGMEDFAGLLRIEYIFHFTLMISAFIVVLYLWKSLGNRS
ncbi:MAG: amino acid adenylation domain-containing protein [Parcubacteria group bacterium Gr01-1014_8]|nr:MAG: amino acid adenylation domain-containing protein [Parcubacteria group bacterium Gr01-1014_8]